MTSDRLASLAAGLDDIGDADDADDIPVIDAEPVDDDPSAVQEMQALLDAFRDPTLHEIQDPRHKRIIDELHILSESNIADAFVNEEIIEVIGEDDDGTPITQVTKRLTTADIKALPERVQRQIKRIKITSKPSGDVIDIEMYDKNTSIEKLMRHYGLYELDNKQAHRSPEDTLLDLMFSQVASKGLPPPVVDIDEGDEL